MPFKSLDKNTQVRRIRDKLKQEFAKMYANA